MILDSTSVLGDYAHLVNLDLGLWANQSILSNLKSRQLRYMSMAGSENALNILCLREQHHLEFLDVTLCSKISYEATLQLRQFLPNLMIRRVPFDGQYERAGDFAPFCVWPDGTVAQENDSTPTGFIDTIKERNSVEHPMSAFYVTYELPFNSTDPERPEYRRYFQYIAASLLVVDSSTLMSSQFCRGKIFSPHSCPNMSHAGRLAHGEEIILDQRGEMSVDVRSPDAYISMLKLKRTPWEGASAYPPPDLLRYNWEYMQSRQRWILSAGTGQKTQRTLRAIHLRFGGSIQDVVSNFYPAP